MNTTQITQITTKGFDLAFWQGAASKSAQIKEVEVALGKCKATGIEKSGFPKRGADASRVLKLYKELDRAFEKAKKEAKTHMGTRDTVRGIDVYLERIKLGVATVEQVAAIAGAEAALEDRRKAIAHAKRERDAMAKAEDEAKRDLSNCHSLLKAGQRAYEATGTPLDQRRGIIQGAIEEIEKIAKAAAERVKAADKAYERLWDEGGLVMKARVDGGFEKKLAPRKGKEWARESNGLFKELNDTTTEFRTIQLRIGNLSGDFDAVLNDARNLDLESEGLDKARVRTRARLEDALKGVSDVEADLKAVAAKIQKQADTNLPKLSERIAHSEPPYEALKKSAKQFAEFTTTDLERAKGLYGRVPGYEKAAKGVHPMLAEEVEIKALITAIKDDVADAEGAYKDVLAAFESFRKAYAQVKQDIKRAIEQHSSAPVSEGPSASSDG